MRIIKRKELPETEICCDTCESLLAYTKKDIYNKTFTYLGEFRDYEYIRCPVCNTKIIIN